MFFIVFFQVSQLYKLAFQTYHDIPRGPIKVDKVMVMVMVIRVMAVY